MGRAFCETLMDYTDENPNKVNRAKRWLKKTRRKERRARKKEAKLRKLAEAELSADDADSPDGVEADGEGRITRTAQCATVESIVVADAIESAAASSRE